MGRQGQIFSRAASHRVDRVHARSSDFDQHLASGRFGFRNIRIIRSRVFAIGEAARGKGVASTTCEHSLSESLAREFKAMWYNLATSTDERAVKRWQHHGFEIVGTLSKASRHTKLGYVDAYLKNKWLVPSS